MYFTKTQGPRPARGRGPSRPGKWFSTFSLFPQRHPAAHIQPSLPIDGCDLQRISPFFRSHLAGYLHESFQVWRDTVNPVFSNEFNWIFFLIHVWNELIDFCDFFIMFPCRDLSVPLPPPPIHPFSSCINYELQPLNITLYSHLMMGPHDIQTWTQQIDFLKAF